MGQTLGEGTLLKVSVCMSWERWGVISAWGQVNSWAKRFAWGDWGQEENMCGALSRLCDLEEQRGKEGEDGVASHKGTETFLWGRWPLQTPHKLCKKCLCQTCVRICTEHLWQASLWIDLFLFKVVCLLVLFVQSLCKKKEQYSYFRYICSCSSH